MTIIRIQHEPLNDNAAGAMPPTSSSAETGTHLRPAPLFPTDEMPAQAMFTNAERDVWNPIKIVGKWASDGPLVHQATGIEPLDRTTGGGPIYGTRWVIIGAPDAGKTALLVQIATSYVRAGVVVGLLAVDEDPDDISIRLAQRAGVERERCERRTPEDLAAIRDAFKAINIRIYDFRWTIEDAAEDLVTYAAGRRVMLGVDSLQTVRCNAELGQKSTAENVGLRMQAVRAVAVRHRLISIATSEMNRSGYRSKKDADDMNPLALGKWSSDIEYQARVVLSLSNVAQSPDLIKVDFAKNKHWHPRGLPRGEAFYLQINRANQVLTTADAPPAEADMKSAEQVTRDAAALIEALYEEGGMHARGLREWAKGAKIGRRRLEDAMNALGDGLVKVESGRSTTYSIDASKLSEYWQSMYRSLTEI